MVKRVQRETWQIMNDRERSTCDALPQQTKASVGILWSSRGMSDVKPQAILSLLHLHTTQRQPSKEHLEKRGNQQHHIHIPNKTLGNMNPNLSHDIATQDDTTLHEKRTHDMP